MSDDESLPRDIADRRDWRERVLARTPGRDDARELLDHAVAIAALEFARGDVDAARVALAEAAAAGAVAMVAYESPDESAGEIRWPNGAARSFPGGRTLNPSDWWRALGCALAIRDAEAIQILIEPAHVAALAADAGFFDDFWLPLCSGAAAVVRGERADDDLTRAHELLARARISRGDPAVIESQIAPWPRVWRALASANAAGFAEALRAAVAAHAKASSALPLELLGLACLARDRGLRFDADLLPSALLERADIARPIVTRVYATRLAQYPEDPTSFLDLRGFPRDRRRHALVTRGADLIATYELADGPGVPRARAEFQLPGAATSTTGVAIDPGERLILAALHARDAAGVPAAVELVDQVLAAIPAGADAVPAGLFVNARGREAHEREPGAFSRERLQAYRRGLTNAADPRSAALTTIEVLKATVAPLLEKLGRARDPQVLASLRPRATDYAHVFADAATADAARAAFDAQWAAMPTLVPVRAELAKLHVFVAPAGMLSSDNELSRNFPGGYRALAPKLNPHVVWVSWKFTRPGESSGGVSFDGLAWCEDHWAWFPKPYRVLSGIAAP